MQQSVPTTSAVQATFVATLVDEWCRWGLRDVVVCPGSRSTPLALAVSRAASLTLHVRIDERSAAFFALGRALATQRPVAIVVTSGTAAAELHAAVAEADLAHVPLLVLTADRPPELHGVGAPQTIDQNQLFGAKVRLYEEPGVARLEAAASWRPLAQRLYCRARGDQGTAGPVHLNAAFVEPLLGEALELPAPRSEVHDPTPRSGRDALDLAGRRVLCVVGSGVGAELIDAAWACDWVVVGDATARGALAYADPLCRHDLIWDSLCPDVVVRMGGIPASKFLAQRLASGDVPVLALDAGGPVADPDAIVTRRVAGGPDPSDGAHRGDAAYVGNWREASDRVERGLRTLDEGPLDEVRVARRVVEAANRSQSALVVGSSMPVRDVEWWTPPRTSPVYANRGANGIDGVVSTFLGVASGSRAIGLVGDVTMLHDVSALVEGTGSPSSAVLVVSDNRGGGIFSFLAQARELSESEFERLFATPRELDLVAVAAGFGHHAQRVTTTAQLDAAIESALARVGLSVVVAEVPARHENVARHEQLNALVGQWWAAP